MDLYNSNLALLRKVEPGLFYRLLRVSRNTSSHLKQKLSLPLLLNFDLRNADVVVVLGFGMGRHIPQIVERISRSCFLLIIESDLGIFKEALHHINLIPLFSNCRVSLSVGEDPFNATRVRLDNYYGVLTIAKIKVIEYSPSIEVSPTYYQKVRDNLKDAAEMAVRNIATMSKFSSIWRGHVLKNITAIIKNPGANTLWGKFKDIPSIIVAAGPSLDKNVLELKKAKNRALIVCVDTALRTLYNNGIRPDLVVSIDAQDFNLKDFEGVELTEEVLLAVPVVYPPIIERFNNRVFITSYGHPLVDWLERSIGKKGYTKVGGSVATTCFDFLIRAGANPIIFVGQDLAFTEGKTHTGCSFEVEDIFLNSIDKFCTLEMMYREMIKERQDLIEVEDIYGGKVETSKQMLGWLKWLESQVKESGRVCIDATEGGARIKGTRVMRLKDAIKYYCKKEVNIKGILYNAIDLYRQPRTEALVEEMKRLIQECYSLEEIGKKGKETASKLIDILFSEKRTTDVTSQLFSQMGSFYQQIFGNHYLMELFRWSIEPLIAEVDRLKQGKSPMVVAKRCEHFFQEIMKIIREIILQLEEAKVQLEDLELQKGMRKLHTFWLEA
ncbi:MAG: DUF115 domain-containing protein [bacterium]|nr:DUF115 domain-containing protein [bacterium]